MDYSVLVRGTLEVQVDLLASLRELIKGESRVWRGN